MLFRSTARDHLEVGKVFLLAKEYDEAARCFEKAVAQDAALKPFCPDLERLRAAARIFRGQFTANGNRLGVRWGFKNEDEADDFIAVEGRRRIAPKAGLELTGNQIAYVVVKDIPFRDRVKVSTNPVNASSSAHFLGVRFRLSLEPRETRCLTAYLVAARSIKETLPYAALQVASAADLVGPLA